MRAIFDLRILILFLLVFPWSAQAKLTVLCVAEKFQGEILRDGRRTHFQVAEETRVHQVVERDLIFVPGEGSEYKANLSFQFQNLPNATLNLEITEVLNGNKIRYSTKSALVREGRELARGTHWISFGISRRERIYFHCDSYDKTETLTAPAAPRDVRERLRRQKLGLPGAVRSYKGEIFPLDAYDLFQQIMRSRGEDSEIIRRTFQDLQARGFKLITMSALSDLYAGVSADVDADGRDNILLVGFDLYGPIKQEYGLFPWRLLKIEFSVEVLRDPATRVIRGYKVLPGVSFRGVEKEAGGGANTSGGRIMP